MRISPTLYILYLFVFLLVACNRRELTYSPEATITISADWSQSGLNEKEQDYGATAIFYPTDGSTPFVALMGDRTYKTLCLKEGCYNVVLFNRSFDDFGNLCFRGEENYQTLEAYVKKMEIRNESSSERIIMESPDELAADYIEGFEVTSDMPENYSSAITQQSNRNSTRNENSCHLRFTPKKLTQKITVKIRIKGMNNIRKATCTLDGIAESIFLVSKQNSEKTVTQVLRLSNPIYDSGSVTEGTLSTTISEPCSVAVFTIGLLLAFSKRVNIFLVMFLCHWALIGFTKTYFFHIPEDFLLASSAVPGLYLFFKEYTASHLHTSTLFRARMINLALIIACGAIGVLFMISMVCELAQEQALSK